MSIQQAINQTLEKSGRELLNPRSPTDGVLASLRRLRHWARLEFIKQTTNEWHPQSKELSDFDVENALIVLKEDSLVEAKRFNDGRIFYRIKREY